MVCFVGVEVVVDVEEVVGEVDEDTAFVLVEVETVAAVVGGTAVVVIDAVKMRVEEVNGMVIGGETVDTTFVVVAAGTVVEVVVGAAVVLFDVVGMRVVEVKGIVVGVLGGATAQAGISLR